MRTLREFFTGRSIKYGTNVTAMVTFVLGILLLIGIISTRHNYRFDLTANKRYTLSEQTQKLLKSLDQELKVIAFYREGQAGKEIMADLLKQYTDYSPLFTYEFVDPDRDPGKAKVYEITSYGTTVIESLGRRQTVSFPDEEPITNAILKVTREKKKIVYFLKGHGEKDITNVQKEGYSEAKTAIEKQNYEVKELLLLREEGIPSDATLLVIAGPQKDLLPGEIDLLRQFIRQDGKVLVMIDPETSPELVTLLTEYGVEVGNNVIVDELSRFFGASKLIPVVSQYQSHPITQNFNLASFFPLARSVEVKPNIAGITAQPLAFTGQSSWAETDLESVKDSPIFQEGVDKRGPLPVAAVVTVDQAKLHEHEESATTEEKKDDASEKGTKARLVVFGDSDFSSNTYFNLSGNQDLFLNTISWLAEEETLIAIRPKDRKTQPILLTPNQAKVIFWLPVIVLPATVIVIGTLVCNQRRK